jgi:hypothetical protein
VSKPEKFYNNNRITLPEGFDPYDIDLKKQLHDQADEKNFIHHINGTPVLACGAKKSNGKACTSYAGRNTDHVGHGRCKQHGGCNTGPKTEEGKAIASQNSRIHGLYSSVLSKEERAIFDEMAATEEVGLKHEIMVLKAKILVYLQKWRRTYDDTLEKKGELQAEAATTVWFREGEGTTSTRGYYHAGTIEDRVLDRALNTLRRLVETYNRLSAGSDGDSLVNQINNELRQASHGQVSLSWGGKAQSRQEGGADNGGTEGRTDREAKKG